YGLVHQFGTNKAGRSKNVKIPARPFLPVDRSGNLPGRAKDVVKKVVIKFVEDSFK
ncbi:MAG: phage morphogenesis protein, partial [Campylobacter sp.]